jgi:hypothetical protein
VVRNVVETRRRKEEGEFEVMSKNAAKTDGESRRRAEE